MRGTTAALGWVVEASASVRRVWGVYLEDENALPVRDGALVDVRLRRAVRRLVVFGFVLTDFSGGRAPYGYPCQPRVSRAGVTVALP